MKNKVTKIQTMYVDKQLSHSQCVQVPRCTLDPNNCNFDAKKKEAAAFSYSITWGFQMKIN